MRLDLRGLRKLRPRKHRPQTPEKLRPPEKLIPQGVSNTQTLNIFQILQLTIVCQQPLSLSQPEKRTVLQKYLLSENSHWQNLDKTKFFYLEQWSFVPTGKRFDCSRGNHILDEKGYFGTRVITPQTNNGDSHKLLFLFPVLPAPSARTLVIQDKGSINWSKVIL